VARLQPTSANAWNSLCWSHALAGELEQALGNCNEALRLAPDDGNTLDSRGLVHLKLARFAEALADYDAAHARLPKLASALYGRGLARQKQGDTAGEADIAAAKALKADIAEEFAGYGVQ